jgi:hypothetical protein
VTNAIRSSTPHDIWDYGDLNLGILPRVVQQNVVEYSDGSVHQPGEGDQ